MVATGRATSITRSCGIVQNWLDAARQEVGSETSEVVVIRRSPTSAASRTLVDGDKLTIGYGGRTYRNTTAAPHRRDFRREACQWAARTS